MVLTFELCTATSKEISKTLLKRRDMNPTKVKAVK